MRTRMRVASMLAVVTFTACTHVPWTGKYISAPTKRSHASEDRAIQAINAFFNASTDLIGLAAVDIHDDCLAAYWETGPLTPQRKKRMDADKVCSYMVERFDAAAYELAGYGQAPSGKYPWLGEVFEYVVRTETGATKNDKMASLDRYVINKFEEMMKKHQSSIIRHVADDYYRIRGTCCRDVTLFDDWYKSRFSRISSK